MKWANLIVDYEREANRMRNFGDDLQIAAINHLYSYMDIDVDQVVRIKVSELSSYDGEYVILPINYPLYGTYKGLSKRIIPVYLGLSMLSVAEADSLRLREFTPIGCRDAYTMYALRDAGIDAYLNGCMTLTLPKRPAAPINGKPFFIDVCDELLEYVPQDMLEKAEFGTHLLYHTYITEEETLKVYEKYCNEASIVVTSRLHCAVPCVAMGIPVVYACKEISFRSWWLENIIPIYDQSTFVDIEWNPTPIDCEDLKDLMLENASQRLRQTWKNYEKPLSISERLESNETPNYVVEALRSSYAYLEKKDKTQPWQYIIWGNTQTAEILYSHIEKEHPEAEFVGLIDLFQDTYFHGFKPSDLSLLDEAKNATIFVSVESANVMALDEFEKRGITDYVLCWKKLDYDLQEQRR